MNDVVVVVCSFVFLEMKEHIVLVKEQSCIVVFLGEKTNLLLKIFNAKCEIKREI